MEKVFEKWKIEECIGEGAFGKVYRITREEFGHKYYSAMKVLHIPQSEAEVNSVRNEGMTEANLTQYFESMVTNIIEEFTLMEKLKGNSYIVSCEDHEVIKRTGSFGWDIYIRMELLTPLFKYVNEKGFSVIDVVHLGIDICRALEICQKYNIIHRDIKPENIFVSDVGDFKLGDFGIARELDKTSGGLSKKGTRNYMAPEVYKGEAYNSTIDIYSLGIVMYRFLNGNRLPFLPLPPNPILYSDKEYAEMSRMSGQPMPAPIDAPPELAKAVLKACSYLPAERYSSAREMRKDLERILYLMDEEENMEENDFSKEEQMPSYSETQMQDNLNFDSNTQNNSSMSLSGNFSQGMKTFGNMSNMSLSGNFSQGSMQSSSGMSQSSNYSQGSMQLSSGMSQSGNFSQGMVQSPFNKSLSGDFSQGMMQSPSSMSLSGNYSQGAMQSPSGSFNSNSYEGTVQLGSVPGVSTPDQYEGTVQLGSVPGVSTPDQYEGTVQLGSLSGASALDQYEGTVQLGSTLGASALDQYEGTVQLGSMSNVPMNDTSNREMAQFDSMSKIADLENNLNGYDSTGSEKKEKSTIVKLLIVGGVVIGLVVFIVLALLLSKPKQKEEDTTVTATAVATTEEPLPTEEPVAEETVKPTEKVKKTPKVTKKPTQKPVQNKTNAPVATKKPVPNPTKRPVVTKKPTPKPKPKKTRDPFAGDGHGLD